VEVISMSQLEQKVVDMPGSTPEGPSARTVTSRPHLGLTREEMNWAALAHASILITFLIGVATGGLGAFLGVAIPAIIWYVYREKSDYVAEQAKQATVFQLAGVLGWYLLLLGGVIVLAIGAVVGAVLTIVLVGLLLLLAVAILAVVWGAAVVVLPIAQVVYGCYAAVETYNGRPFRYRWIADLGDRYLPQA
jgi:uncharacterized Tic20 family protein